MGNSIYYLLFDLLQLMEQRLLRLDDLARSDRDDTTIRDNLMRLEQLRLEVQIAADSGGEIRPADEKRLVPELNDLHRQLFSVSAEYVSSTDGFKVGFERLEALLDTIKRNAIASIGHLDIEHSIDSTNPSSSLPGDQVSEADPDDLPPRR